MSVDTSHTITRFLCWSSTGNAAARPMPAQHCISGRAHRRNTASAPLIQTQSPDRAPQSQHPCALDGFWHPPRQGQIAIARGAFPTSTPRGFLPWGLSDDGPSACPHSRDGPSSETLHKSGTRGTAEACACGLLRRKCAWTDGSDFATRTQRSRADRPGPIQQGDRPGPRHYTGNCEVSCEKHLCKTSRPTACPGAISRPEPRPDQDAIGSVIPCAPSALYESIPATVHKIPR